MIRVGLPASFFATPTGLGRRRGRRGGVGAVPENSSGSAGAAAGGRPGGRGGRLGEQAQFDQVGQAEFCVFADGDGGHGHQGVVVEGVEGLVGRAGLAAQDVEPPADRVEHPPQTGPVFGMAVQVGLQGAVPVGPAAQGPLGVAVPAPFLLVGAGGFDLGHLLVELGQGTALGLVDQLGRFGRVGGHPVGYRLGLLHGQFAGQGGGGHLGLVGQAAAGLQGPFGRRRAHTGLIGQLLRRGAVAGVLPALGLRGPGRGQRFDRRGRRLDLRAQPDHLATPAPRSTPRRRTGRRRRPSIVEQPEALGTWRDILIKGIAKAGSTPTIRPTPNGIERMFDATTRPGQRQAACFW